MSDAFLAARSSRLPDWAAFLADWTLRSAGNGGHRALGGGPGAADRRRYLVAA
jgi:hypothetical protein